MLHAKLTAMKNFLAAVSLAFLAAGVGSAQASDIQCREYFSRGDAEFNLVLDLDSMTISLPDPDEQGGLIDLPILNETTEEVMASGYAGNLISLVLNRQDGGLWVSHFTEISTISDAPRGFRSRFFRCRWDLPD
jgi:hypothetical protein